MKAKINNVVPLYKAPKLTRFNVIPIEWKKIETTEGKRLKSTEIEVLWTIYRIALHNQTAEVKLDYKSLILFSNVECSQRQMSRYLSKLKDTLVISYEIRKSTVDYHKELVIKIDFNKLGVLTETTFDVQTCRSNLSSHIIDKNKNKEVEILLRNNISTSYKKEKIKNKKEKESKETSESEKYGSFRSDVLSTEEEPDLPINNVIYSVFSKIQPSKEKPLEITKEEQMELRLQQEIIATFPRHIATELIENCKFTLIEEDKIQVTLGQGITISEQERDKLRKAIRAVYGSEMRITSGVLQPGVEIFPTSDTLGTKENEGPEVKNENINHVWKVVLEDIKKYYGKDLYAAWFNKLEFLETSKDTLAICAPSEFIRDWVYSNYGIAIAKAWQAYDPLIRFIDIFTKEQFIEKKNKENENA
jgi:hypothetical protein